jgi:NAD(P)-dependent dehydrogenase (short-subunit alcohol dehydrogenase family)
MAEAGAQVVLADILADPLERAVAVLRNQGCRVIACHTDISSAAGNQAMVELAQAEFGGVDIFHANAAVMEFTQLHSMQPREPDRIIDVNLKGPIHGCAAVLPSMVQRRRGTILITASVLASVGDPGLPIYGATKGGLLALCRSLAVNYGPQGIRCNTISPGDVRTPLFDHFLSQSADPAAALKTIINAYPLRRIAEADDIARLAVFLASDDASFISGADIVVDGGLTAQCY